MAVRKEYELEQIDSISDFLYKILFPHDFKLENFESFKFYKDFVGLKLNLSNLIENYKFCDAEDLLFDEISKNNSSRFVLQIGVWFFWKLNAFDDVTLKNNNFSRNEILKGLEEIQKMVFKFE